MISDLSLLGFPCAKIYSRDLTNLNIKWKKNVHNVEHVMRETCLYNSGLWSTSTEQNQYFSR